MKQIIKNYTFTATAKTVVFSDFATISLDRLLLITNVTSNIVIYQFNNNTLGGTVSGNTVTLTYNTGSMANTDKLQIIYDCATGDPVYDAVSMRSSSATGATAPATAFLMGGQAAVSGNLTALQMQSNASDGNATVIGIVDNAMGFVFNGTTWDRTRSITNVTNAVGTGVMAAGLVGQFDDVAPVTITENQYGALRMSVNRNLYGTIRDAAGNERGANVTATNALLVDGSAATQPISATTLPLPTGSATSANQTAANTSLASIDTKTAALGQATMVASSPVVIASNQSAIPISGTITANIGTSTGLAQDATLTGGAQVTKITDGTQSANTIAGDTGQNALLTAGSRKEVAFSTTTAQAVAATDTSNYRWVSVHVVAQGTSSTINFQVSNDNSNWTTLNLLTTTSTAGTVTASTTNAGVILHGALPGRYFRLNVTGITAGTTAGVVEFFTSPGAYQGLGVTALQTGTWNVGASTVIGSAAPANAFYMGITSASGNLTGITSAGSAAGTPGTGVLAAGSMGIYNSTPPTIASGNYERLQLDSSGNLKVNVTAGTQTVQGGYTEQASLSAGALNADLVPSTDVSLYKSFSLQILGTYSGTLTFQGSNDNSNWMSVLAENTANSSTSYVSSTSLANAILAGPIHFRYFRVRMTTYTSGSAAGVLELYATPPATNIASTSQSGTWTVQPGNTPNTAPWLVRGSDGTNSTTIKAASTAAIAADTAEVVALSPNSPLPAGTNTIGGVSLKTATTGGPTVARIMSAGTTNATSVKASAGQLYAWFLANNATYDVFIKFYNKASAPTIGTDTPLFTIKIPAGGASNIEFSLGVPFSTGIAYGITKSVTDTDTTSVVQYDLSGFFTYA